MAMSGGETRAGVAEINVTPLIDVLLVLLIIFMVITPVIPHGMETSVPKPARDVPVRAQGPVMLEVHAASSGSAAVPGVAAPTAVSYRVDGERVGAEGLGEALRSRLNTRQQRMLLVSADRSLSYDTVAQAMAVAKDAGAWPIGIAGAKDLGGVR